MFRSPRFRMRRPWRARTSMRFGPPLISPAYMPMGPRRRVVRRWGGGCCLLPGCVLPITFMLVAVTASLIALF